MEPLSPLRRAWRTGLVLAWICTALIALGSSYASPAVGVLCAVAWLAGVVVQRAHTSYEQRRELEQRAAAARARRAELEQLERELLAAPDEAARVRVLERLAGLELLALVLVLVLHGCAGDAAELEPLDVEAGDDAGEQLELEQDAQAELDAGELEPEQVDWLALVYPHCAGAWADREDSSTRFVAHPDTGLCTFACRWLEPKCDEPWYGDPRCFPAHEQRLEQVCAELGGTCELASDGEHYCEAAP